MGHLEEGKNLFTALFLGAVTGWHVEANKDLL